MPTTISLLSCASVQPDRSELGARIRLYLLQKLGIFHLEELNVMARAEQADFLHRSTEEHSDDTLKRTMLCA